MFRSLDGVCSCCNRKGPVPLRSEQGFVRDESFPYRQSLTSASAWAIIVASQPIPGMNRSSGRYSETRNCPMDLLPFHAGGEMTPWSRERFACFPIVGKKLRRVRRSPRRLRRELRYVSCTTLAQAGSAVRLGRRRHQPLLTSVEFSRDRHRESSIAIPSTL